MHQSRQTTTTYDVPLLMYTMMPWGGSLKAPYLGQHSKRLLPPTPDTAGAQLAIVETTTATVRFCL